MLVQLSLCNSSCTSQISMWSIWSEPKGWTSCSCFYMRGMIRNPDSYLRAERTSSSSLRFILLSSAASATFCVLAITIAASMSACKANDQGSKDWLQLLPKHLAYVTKLLETAIATALHNYRIHMRANQCWSEYRIGGIALPQTKLNTTSLCLCMDTPQIAVLF